MKKVSIWLFALAVMAASPCALASGYAPAISNGAVVPGVWNSSLANCRQYVKDHPGTPMMLVWSKIGCHNCENFDQNCLTADVFKKWQAESGMVFCYINHQKYDGYELNWIGGNHSNDGCDPNYLSAAPFVRVYWYDAKGKKITDVRFSGINLKTDRTKSTVENLIIKLTGLLPGWQAKPAYEGGTFVATNVVGACMEVEPSTKTLNIPLTRTATTAYTQTMTIKKQTKLLTATPSSSVQISWAADETEKILPIENFYPDYYEDGATYELSLTNAEGKVESSTIVRCVPAQANSSMNPYWIGERTAETLEWGDWTMDLEAASNKVANTEGACLIMYIGGELWCPWCEKGEKNFLSSEEFKQWTADHRAVIAQIDCPKQHVSSPTLLSDEVNTSSIAPNGIASGSGYLTRKMADREIAREIFERNYNIVSNAFRRPESSAWRTGMGTFILIDRTFRVVGRLEWKRGDADESKRTEEQLKADIASNILRLNELYSLMNEENEESNQNWYTTKAEIAPIATVTNNTLSASDRIDTFRIPAASVGQTQMYSVKTKESAKLTLKVIRVPAGSGPIVAGNEQVLATSGLMKDAQSEDVSVSLVVPDANCYVVVEGDAATTFKTDYQTSNPNSTLRAYTLDSDAVLIPKEVRATAESKPGTATVQMKLEKDAVYRLEGLDEAACAEFVTPVAGKAGFYTALADGVAPLVLKVQLSTGTGTVTYQKWVDGDIGFVKTGDSVKEDVCDKTGEPLKIAVSRAGGVSGKVIARVTLSEKTSLLAEDAEHPRFVFEQTDLVWEEGVATNQYVNLRIIDYNDVYYGEGNVVLDVELLPDPSGESGSTVRAGHAEYKLFVSELNVRAPGRALVTRAEPYFAKKQTVYVREGEDATFYVKRIENQDGLVNAIVKSSVKGVSFDTDDWRDFGYESDAEAKAAREKFGSLTNEVNFYWSHHESAEKPIRVRGVKKGQTAKISLTAYNMKGTPAKQQFRIVAASNYVNVVGVAANAPAFEDPSPEAWFANRYVADSRVFKLAGEPVGKVTFVKTLGTLPAGLKASYDEGENALRLSGVPTCKAGTYTVVYQVKDGTVAGLTCEITIVVSDPTDVKGAPEYANPAVAKSRTLKNIPAFQKDAGGKVRLVGSLQVTIPPKGNVSAKLTCAAGTVAFSAKSWSKFNSEGEQDRALYADPVSKNGYAMEVKAETNGCVRVIITPPGEDVELILATSAGTSWSSANNAKAWNGYYTVALPVTEGEGAVREEVYGTAPRGVGYLTLKMTTATAWNKGTFTYGGMLPNGTAVSGSAVLVDDGLVDGEGYSWGMLPLFKKSSTDLISLPIDILKDAVGLHGEKPRCVLADDKVDPEEGAVPQWTHAEKDAEAQAGYAADLDICGSLYLTTEPLTRCCDEGYSTEQNLSFTVAKLGSLNGGTPSGLSQPIKITVEDNALKADSTQLTAEKVTFKFVRSTGLVSGTWKLPYTLDGGATWKYVSATWKGVVLTGWGDCCIPENARPFVNGSFYFTEKRSYEKAGRQKTVTLKRGGALEIQ